MEGKEKRDVIVQSVARALTMISCFANDTELGISEIAERMDLSKSMTYGLVNTLTAFGYLERTENKKYRLGLKLFELGNLVQSRMDVRMGAWSCCQPLADKHRTTVHLTTHSEGEITYIDKVGNDSSVVVYSRIGKRAPIYYTGVGKAILAFLPEEYMEKYVLPRPLIKMTEHTITTGDGLLKELEQIRERGYAVNDEEIEPGPHCIAAPIFNRRRQPQMAILMSFPYGRMWGLDWEQAVRDVLYYAKQASERPGYIK